MKTLLIATGFALTSISTAVMAHDSHHSCNINFDKDISITSELVSMKDAGTELWRINSNGQLWLDGRQVETDRDTQKLLKDYQAGVRTQTLETVALVEDALVLAADAVNSVLTELTGDTLDSHPSLQNAMDKIKTSTETVVKRNGDSVEIYGSRFDNIDDAFGEEFEQAIEEAVTSSMGSILMIVGKAMSSGEGNFEQRMEAFGEKMERFGEDLEARMESKAQLLEQRGDAMCANLQQLDALRGLPTAPLRYYQPPDRFDARIEFEYEIESSQALLFPLRRLLLDLAAFLCSRDGGVQRFDLHFEPAPTAIARSATKASQGCSVPGAAMMPTKAVKMTSDITRGLSSAK